MSTASTIATMTLIIEGIRSLVRIFWIFVFWRRKTKVYDALKALHVATQDESIRKALNTVKYGRDVIKLIDSHPGELKLAARQYGELDKQLKLLLHETKTIAEEIKREAERERKRGAH